MFAISYIIQELKELSIFSGDIASLWLVGFTTIQLRLICFYLFLFLKYIGLSNIKLTKLEGKFVVKGLSIVIPTKNNQHILAPLISSINSQNIDFPIEVIIVDNSKKGIRLDLKCSKGPITFARCAPGVNRARNKGLQLANSEIILFLDDDCRLKHPATLATHHFYHNSNSDIFAIGGGYEPAEGASFYSLLYNQLQMSWLYNNYLYQNGYEAACLIGGHFSIKKSLVKHNGIFFDETIAYGGSEVSFFKKAYNAKLKMLLLNIKVIHETHETFSSLTLKFLKQGKNHQLHDNFIPNVKLNLYYPTYKLLDENNKIHFLSGVLFAYFKTIYWWSAYSSNNRMLGFVGHFMKELKFNLTKKRIALRVRLLSALKKS